METFELLNLKAFLIEVRGLHLRPDLSLERRHPIVQPAFVLQAQPLLLQFESAGMTIRQFDLKTTSILGTEFLQTTILFVAELRFEVAISALSRSSNRALSRSSSTSRDCCSSAFNSDSISDLSCRSNSSRLKRCWVSYLDAASAWELGGARSELGVEGGVAGASVL